MRATTLLLCIAVGAVSTIISVDALPSISESPDAIVPEAAPLQHSDKAVAEQQPTRFAATQQQGLEHNEVLIGTEAVAEPPAAKKQELYISNAWQRMHIWDIKMKQSALDTGNIAVAHEKCALINQAQQRACGQLYCKSGETASCGGICEKGTNFFLTPMNVDVASDQAWFQASELDTKEKASKAEKAQAAAFDAALHDHVEQGKIKTKSNEDNVTAIETSYDSEKDEKKQYEESHKEVVEKAEEESTNWVQEHMKATASEASVKGAQKAAQLQLELQGCKAKANQTKVTCTAVEKAEKQQEAAGSAKMVQKEIEAVEEAEEEGSAALAQEQAAKKEAYDNAKKELAEKAELALPSNLPKGNFEWNLDKPCDGGAGAFSQQIEHDEKVVIGTVPIGKNKLRIDLSSAVDVDIELYDGKTGEAIIAWMEGKIDSASEDCSEHAGNNICYSGYFGVDFNSGEEWITVDGPEGTTHPYIMKAYGFSAGVANVTYTWEGLSNGCVNPVVPQVILANASDVEAAQDADTHISASGSGSGSASPVDEGGAAVSMVQLLMADPDVPEMCQIESDEALDECATMSDKEVSKKFGNTTADFKATQNGAMEKESTEKKAAAAKLDAEFSEWKTNSTAIGGKLSDQLDAARIEFYEEKKGKKKEIKEKEEAETKRRAEEKAYKDAAPERDSKERARKALPQCKEATSRAVSGCRKVTDKGFVQCAAIYEQVPMSKKILRPNEVIAGKPEIEHGLESMKNMYVPAPGFSPPGGEGSAAQSADYLAAMGMKQNKLKTSQWNAVKASKAMREANDIIGKQEKQKKEVEQHTKNQLDDLMKFSHSMEKSYHADDPEYDDDEQEAEAWDREHRKDEMDLYDSGLPESEADLRKLEIVKSDGQ